MRCNRSLGKLRSRYWGQHLWARGYFCASSGTVTDEMIKAYIEQQKAPPDDGFIVTDNKLHPPSSALAVIHDFSRPHTYRL